MYELVAPLLAKHKLRLVVCPGPVVSRTDGEFHWIGAKQLASLYRLPPWAYSVFDMDNPKSRAGRSLTDPKEVFLHPRQDGNYDVHEAVMAHLRPRTR